MHRSKLEDIPAWQPRDSNILQISRRRPQQSQQSREPYPNVPGVCRPDQQKREGVDEVKFSPKCTHQDREVAAFEASHQRLLAIVDEVKEHSVDAGLRVWIAHVQTPAPHLRKK